MSKLYEKYLSENEQNGYILSSYHNVVQALSNYAIKGVLNIGENVIGTFSIKTDSINEGIYNEEMAFVKIKSIDIQVVDGEYDNFISKKGQGYLLETIEETLQNEGEKEFKAGTTFVSDDEGEDSLQEFVRMIIREIKKNEQRTYSLNLDDFYICVFLKF